MARRDRLSSGSKRVGTVNGGDVLLFFSGSQGLEITYVTESRILALSCSAAATGREMLHPCISRAWPPGSRISKHPR
jgi:hypothetical protein